MLQRSNSNTSSYKILINVLIPKEMRNFEYNYQRTINLSSIVLPLSIYPQLHYWKIKYIIIHFLYIILSFFKIIDKRIKKMVQKFWSVYSKTKTCLYVQPSVHFFHYPLALPRYIQTCCFKPPCNTSLAGLFFIFTKPNQFRLSKVPCRYSFLWLYGPKD